MHVCVPDLSGTNDLTPTGRTYCYCTVADRRYSLDRTAGSQLKNSSSVLSVVHSTSLDLSCGRGGGVSLLVPRPCRIGGMASRASARALASTRARSHAREAVAESSGASASADGSADVPTAAAVAPTEGIRQIPASALEADPANLGSLLGDWWQRRDGERYVDGFARRLSLIHI